MLSDHTAGSNKPYLATDVAATSQILWKRLMYQIAVGVDCFNLVGGHSEHYCRLGSSQQSIVLYLRSDILRKSTVAPIVQLSLCVVDLKSASLQVSMQLQAECLSWFEQIWCQETLCVCTNSQMFRVYAGSWNITECRVDYTLRVTLLPYFLSVSIYSSIGFVSFP